MAILRDLLQAIKEAALRFTQLLERRRQAEADSRHREVERCEGNDQVISSQTFGNYYSGTCDSKIKKNDRKEIS